MFHDDLSIDECWNMKTCIEDLKNENSKFPNELEFLKVEISDEISHIDSLPHELWFANSNLMDELDKMKK